MWFEEGERERGSLPCSTTNRTKHALLYDAPGIRSGMLIPRRSFLKTAAVSVVPTAALHDVIAQVRAMPSSTEVHSVGAGQDGSGEKHSLGISSIAFKVESRETGGNLFILESSNLTPGVGPPLHLHFAQEEWFYVMDGQVAVQIGDSRLRLAAGESVLAPRRVPHTFSATGHPARMLFVFAPAGKMEQFFRDGEKNLSKLYSPEFMSQYGMQMIGPSPFRNS